MRPLVRTAAGVLSCADGHGGPIADELPIIKKNGHAGHANGHAISGAELVEAMDAQADTGQSHTRAGWEALLSEETREAGGKLTERQAVWLDAFVLAGGNVSEACRTSNTGRRTPYQWANVSPAFVEARARAWDVIADALEAEGMRRALAGATDPQSGTILVAMLKAHGAKDKWRPEIKHTHGGDVRHSHRIKFGGPRANERLPKF